MNHTQPVTLLKLTQRVDAAFAEAQQAIAESQRIMRDVMAVQARLRLAREEYDDAVRSGARCWVGDLPQMREWDENRAAREAAFLLALAK
jgi:hypothetical protein